MILRGEFRDLSDELLTVLIKSGGSGEVKEIGKDGLYFAADPVHIEESIEDITEHVIRKSATINLVVSDYLGDLLFTGAARDIVVNIWKGSECVFAGYVEPATFSQPFNSSVDEFTLNCTDFLSTLQYTSYKNIVPLNYRQAVQEAGSTSFMEVLGRIFDTRGLNLNNNQKPRLLYDQSKGTAKGKEGTVFEELSISELFIIGKDEDSTWTNEDLLKEVLQYLNLHIRQEGLDFYIYDWDTLVQGNPISWLDIQTGEVVSKQPQSININPEHYAASDTSLSTSEVINQFQLSCSLEGQDTVIESPLSEDSLKSHYKGQQLILTEISSLGSGKSAHTAFLDAVNGRPTTYDALFETDWYMRSMYSPTWKLRGSDEMLEVDENGVGINQHKVAQYLREHPLTPALLRLGSVERKAKATDNSPTSKIDTDNYLVISIGGNENDTAEGHKPSDNDLKNCNPILEYVGTRSGGVFSPPDSETTNYLVFSGSLLLQPILYESGLNKASRVSSYDQILKHGCVRTQGAKAVVPFYDPPSPKNIYDMRDLNSNLVRSEGNDEGRYYTRKHYSTRLNTDKPLYNSTGSYFQPWTKDKAAQGLKFEYSSVGDSTDKFSKLPILECELKIGSKYCVETVLDVYGDSRFEWLTLDEIKARPDLTYKDVDGTTKYKTTMSLGINPKIGDFIIGQEHSLQNTIDYTMNLDGKEGTAIPIKQSDRLSGRVSFKILAPIQLIWDNIVRRHPTFFRSTKWTSNSRYILAHTENIIIKNFACNIVSDNGKQESTSDNDLIYCSAAQTKYINKHDGTDFKFITQLSSSEAVEKGIKNEVYLNSVFNTSTSLPVRTIYNKVLDETGKAEEHYVSQYYSFMSRPRLKVEVTMNDTGIDFTSTYQSKTLGKKFLVQSVSRDIRNKTARITLIEI